MQEYLEAHSDIDDSEGSSSSESGSESYDESSASLSDKPSVKEFNKPPTY